jgi:molybdenum cofactor cytidylyltransferase
MIRAGESVAGIVLAAGESTRMGRPKQLLQAGGGTLLEGIINEALRSDLDEVILVLGHKYEEIRATLGQVLQHPNLKVIENRKFKKGISSSIIAGLSEVEDNHDHVMILLADMPYIDANLIDLLLRRYIDSRLPLGAIKLKAKRTHPVIFSRKLFHELHNLKGDMGAKNLFEKYADQVCLVEPEGFYDDSDIDTPEDHTKYKKILERK